MSEKIPLSRVYHSEEIDRRILQVVKSGNYILGPECKAFEEELAEFFNVPYCVLSSSWTAAVHLLHLAQIQLGHLQPGDEILVPSITAFPTIEPMIHCGLVPVFCDVDENYTICPNDAASKISTRTRAIMPVHLYGRPADLSAIVKLCEKHKLILIEDCAQSHGAKYLGRRAGSIGQHAAISFYPSKNLTVYGDGGAILTHDAAIAKRVGMLRNHGRKDKYLHEKVGFNLRFNEINAAVGREQLKVIDDLNGQRRQIANWYRNELKNVSGLTLPPEDAPGQTESVYHMFVIRLESNEQRESLANHLRDNGVETGVHYPVPNHRQPAIEELYGQLPALPRTEDWANKILSLPMFPALTMDQVRKVAQEIRVHLGAPAMV